MTREFLVVGSGASAVHFAWTALERGARVTMLDVGKERPAPVRPDDSLTELKANLEDPADYFLGPELEALVLPDFGKEYYGFPPSKTYVFQGVRQGELRAQGFEPLASFARGGLAEAWTGGSYPFNDAELEDFPFGYAELEPWYVEIARRIGISGEDDDLAPHMPVHAGLLPGLELDAHSADLMARYEKKRAGLQARQRCFMGRSRLATLSRDLGERRACSYSGRCLWGCPRGSLYTPGDTLRALHGREGFRYLPGRFVRHFEVEGGRASALVALELASGKEERHAADAVVLAAGTLASARIFLSSWRRVAGEDLVLTGLMDNRQILIPFVNLCRIASSWSPDTYQYHQLNLSLATERPKEYVHGQITTLKTAMIHPIVQNVPLDLRTALFVFRHVHGALGLLNVNLHDTRRAENTLALEGEGADERLMLRYTARDRDSVARWIRVYKRVLRSLACVVPPGMIHVRPMGASVHYAGALPMTATPAPATLSDCAQSHDFRALYVVDGSGFPFLPAKNPTLTLMANASRIAAAATA